MNILMLYTNSPFNEAGNVALDLFNEFGKKGHKVKMLVNEYEAGYPEGIISMQTPFSLKIKAIRDKIRYKLKLEKKTKSDPEYHFQELNESKQHYSTGSLIRKAGIEPDIIVVLYAKNFVNPKNIYELHKRTGAPVYWFNYDMAPFTGGCHYSWDCTGYQRHCGSCPGLHSTDPADLTYRNFMYKKSFFDRTDIRVISGSEGQYRELKQSTLFKERPITKILLAVSPLVFKPVPAASARQKFGISADRKVIFFGAVHLENKRKGIAYLVAALKALKKMLLDDPALDQKITLLVAGQRFDEIESELPFAYHYLGMLRTNEDMANAYQAADVFVCPSLQDAGPTMINQSLMCGTPVVAFETGVALDLVMTGRTGYRAELRNSTDMASGIKTILSQTEGEMMAMRKECRQVAEQMIHPDVNLDHWIRTINGQS